LLYCCHLRIPGGWLLAISLNNLSFHRACPSARAKTMTYMTLPIVEGAGGPLCIERTTTAAEKPFLHGFTVLIVIGPAVPRAASVRTPLPPAPGIVGRQSQSVFARFDRVPERPPPTPRFLPLAYLAMISCRQKIRRVHRRHAMEQGFIPTLGGHLISAAAHAVCAAGSSMY